MIFFQTLIGVVFFHALLANNYNECLKNVVFIKKPIEFGYLKCEIKGGRLKLKKPQLNWGIQNVSSGGVEYFYSFEGGVFHLPERGGGFVNLFLSR